MRWRSASRCTAAPGWRGNEEPAAMASAWVSLCMTSLTRWFTCAYVRACVLAVYVHDTPFRGSLNALSVYSVASWSRLASPKLTPLWRTCTHTLNMSEVPYAVVTTFFTLPCREVGLWLVVTRLFFLFFSTARPQQFWDIFDNKHGCVKVCTYSWSIRAQRFISKLMLWFIKYKKNVIPSTSQSKCNQYSLCDTIIIIRCLLIWWKRGPCQILVLSAAFDSQDVAARRGRACRCLTRKPPNSPVVSAC